MKTFWTNPVIAVLSSLKLSSVLMALVAFAAAKATFTETQYGRDAAYDQVYAARWFEAMLALLTVSLVLIFFKRWPYRPAQFGFMLVHIGMVVILVGAGITRYFGYEGIMAIREGQSSDTVQSDRDHIQASIGEETGSFPVRLWKPGANDIHKKVVVGGKEYELGVTEYWPHFGETFQAGPGGVAVLQYGVTQGDEITTETLQEGARGAIGGVDARFPAGGFSGQMSGSRYGDLRLHIEGETCTFPVVPAGGEVFTCGGYRFQITEFQSHFQVGGQSDPEGPLTNPMVRLKITDPQGNTGERLLFAMHPDFAMGHGGGQPQFEALDMLYQVSLGIEFAKGGETGIQARASFPLSTMDMNDQTRGEVPAGEIFPVREAILYVNEESEFSFVPVKVMTSAVLTPAMSDDPKARSAARVMIRDSAGAQVEVICVNQEMGQAVTLGGQRVRLAYAPVLLKVPYSVFLDDFVLQTYPGSDNPATYESFVTLNDPAKGINGRKVHIYMNYPMNHRGSKHFQSSYDPDRRGTVLSVNHDPGKGPTYFGYGLLTLGFCIIFIKEMSILLKDLMNIDKEKNKTGKTGKTALAGLCLLAALGAGGKAAAQEHGPGDGHNHPVATGFVALSDPAREAASRLIIQDFRGRMKPLDTLARETVMKVAKRTKFEGRQPVDQYLNWSINPNFWWDKPLLAVRDRGLKDLLGVDASATHVSAASLFDGRGQYRLAAQVEEAHRTPDRDRSKTQRKLITFDEDFQILYMTFRGTMLKLFPIPGDENHTWDIYPQTATRLTPEQNEVFAAAFNALTQGVQSGNNAMIMDGIQRTRNLQLQYGAPVMPSPSRVRAELIYNRAHLFSWMMVPLLAAWAVLMTVFTWNLFRGRALQARWKNPFYSLGVGLYSAAFIGMVYAYILRWIASGRAPLSNGHESLLFISLAVALAGLICEFAFRMAAPGSLGALLTVVILGVSMLSTFDPAIGPLVPVLVSYWLNIHVTIITASYGFLGLSALLGALILILMLAKGSGRENLREAMGILDRINRFVLVAGLGLLSVGTLLGGVWANESWGRYWGWDAKETWALITILVYAVVLHFRWIPALRSIWLNSAGSLAAVSSVVMTYFGVNYFLSGLHSYAAGDAAKVPSWVYIFTLCIVALITASGLVNRSRRWPGEA